MGLSSFNKLLKKKKKKERFGFRVLESVAVAVVVLGTDMDDY
jgi:hypothetical protein